MTPTMASPYWGGNVDVEERFGEVFQVDAAAAEVTDLLDGHLL